MPRDRNAFWSGLGRLMHLRLVIPLMRSKHPPGHTARGVAAGIFWAFTPLIPIQMYLLGATWLVARRFPAFDFNLLIALAWVWVTNAFTMVPIYFAFYVTGQMMLGRWDDLMGFAAFSDQWSAVLAEDYVESARRIADLIVREYGLALAIGCVPYALGGAWLGHAATHDFMRRHAERRRRKGA